MDTNPAPQTLPCTLGIHPQIPRDRGAACRERELLVGCNQQPYVTEAEEHDVFFVRGESVAESDILLLLN